jgi:hypothetical protein
LDGNIFNSKGVHVAVVIGPAIFGHKGQKLYDLRGVNIYKLNGDLVGHWRMQKAPRSIWTKLQIGCFQFPEGQALTSRFEQSRAGLTWSGT